MLLPGTKKKKKNPDDACCPIGGLCSASSASFAKLPPSGTKSTLLISSSCPSLDFFHLMCLCSTCQCAVWFSELNLWAYFEAAKEVRHLTCCHRNKRLSQWIREKVEVRYWLSSQGQTRGVIRSKLTAVILDKWQLFSVRPERLMSGKFNF